MPNSGIGKFRSAKRIATPRIITSVALTPVEVDLLNAVADAHRISRSALVRRIIRQYCELYKNIDERD